MLAREREMRGVLIVSNKFDEWGKSIAAAAGGNRIVL